MDYELTLKNEGGVGGRLGYFLWKEFVFQAYPTVTEDEKLICLTLGRLNYFFSKITSPFPKKSHECPLKLTDLWITTLQFDLNYKFINRRELHY